MSFLKRKIVCACLFILMMGASSIHAGEDFTHEVTFGPYASYIKYEEPGVMEETGFMVGVYGDFSVHYSSGLMVGIDGSLGGGLVDYVSQNTGSIDDITDYMFEGRGTIGYDIHLNEKTSRLTPYTGLGYRFLRDEVGGEVTTTGHLGYDRESNYFYVPIGLKFLANVSDSFDVLFNLEYDYFITGRQESELGDAVSGLDTVEHDQDEGYGVRGSVDFVFKSDSFDFTIKPYYRYWSIEQSEIKPLTASGTPIGVLSYEPENNSTEAGLILGIKY